jgi:hypothetical protein
MHVRSIDIQNSSSKRKSTEFSNTSTQRQGKESLMKSKILKHKHAKARKRNSDTQHIKKKIMFKCHGALNPDQNIEIRRLASFDVLVKFYTRTTLTKIHHCVAHFMKSGKQKILGALVPTSFI